MSSYLIERIAATSNIILHTHTEITALEAGGHVVVAVVADEASAAAIGPNPLDPAVRAPSAEAGRRQGRAAAAEVMARWAKA